MNLFFSISLNAVFSVQTEILSSIAYHDHCLKHEQTKIDFTLPSSVFINGIAVFDEDHSGCEETVIGKVNDNVNNSMTEIRPYIRLVHMLRDPRIKFLYYYCGLEILVEAKGNYEIRIFGVIRDGDYA